MAKFSDLVKNIFWLILLLQFAPPLIHHIKKQYSKMLEPRTKVGLLPIKGTISNGSYYARKLKKFFENDDIKAVLLTIESPGGAAGSSEAIAHEIALLKKEFPKPVITLCENVCASGGYYIAAATDFIIASPSSLVGSIGSAIPYQFKVEDWLKDHNITYVPIAAGDYKLSTDPFVNITSEQRAMLSSVAQSSYDYFVQFIAQHRAQLQKADHADWANGRIFSGAQAHEKGLVDALGSRSDALKKLKELALIEGKIEWVRPTITTSFWQMLQPQETPDPEESIVTRMVNAVCIALENRLHQRNHEVMM